MSILNAEKLLGIITYLVSSKGGVWLQPHPSSEISEKIIPFFKKYTILGTKSKDFEDFCIVVEMMKVKKHLTSKGIELIRNVKMGMNTGRDKSFKNKA